MFGIQDFSLKQSRQRSLREAADSKLEALRAETQEQELLGFDAIHRFCVTWEECPYSLVQIWNLSSFDRPEFMSVTLTTQLSLDRFVAVFLSIQLLDLCNL